MAWGKINDGITFGAPANGPVTASATAVPVAPVTSVAPVAAQASANIAVSSPERPQPSKDLKSPFQEEFTEIGKLQSALLRFLLLITVSRA